MSELTVIESVEGEETDLKLHTDLCAQRYNQLIKKFDEVDQRLDALTYLCNEIKESVITMKTTTQMTYLKWAGFVIVVLSSIVGGLLGHLV